MYWQLVLCWEGDPGKPVRMKPLSRGGSKEKDTGGAGEWGLMRDRAGRLERWEQAGEEEDQWDVGLERQAGATFTLSSTLLILTACLLWAWFYSRYWGSERGQNTTILTIMDLQSWKKRKIISQLSKIGTMSDVNFSGGKNNVGNEDLKCLGWGRADISDTVARERLVGEISESRPDIWGNRI